MLEGLLFRYLRLSAVVGYVDAVFTDTDAALLLGASQPFAANNSKMNGYLNGSEAVTYVTM